jgi:hypothetical protein
MAVPGRTARYGRNPTVTRNPGAVTIESKGRRWFPKTLRTIRETLIEPVSNSRQCTLASAARLRVRRISSVSGNELRLVRMTVTRTWIEEETALAISLGNSRWVEQELKANPSYS